MSEVQADLDGIRMLGDLLHRQSQHVAAMADFLHDTCNVTGAFDGVLGLFRGSYSDAFGYATEGLQVSKDANQMLADRCAKTAENYEKADNDGYLAFARLAGAHQMTISPYRPAGSGAGTVLPGGPFEPEKEAADDGFFAQVGQKIDGISAAATGAIDPVTGAVDTVLKPYQTWGKDGVEAIHGAITDDTVLHGGKPVMADRLARMHERAGPEDTRFLPDNQPGAFDQWHGTQKDRIDAVGNVLDPLGNTRDKLVEAGAKKLGLGDHTVGNAETQHRINKGMEWTNNAMDTYGTVKSVAEDPTLGARALAKDSGQMVDSFRDVAHYADISNDKVDTSVLDELKESR